MDRLEADPNPLATIEAALRLPNVGPLLAGTVSFEADPSGADAAAEGGGGGGSGKDQDQDKAGSGEGDEVRVRALLLVYELSREGAEGAAAEELERKLARLLYRDKGDAFGPAAGAEAEGEAEGEAIGGGGGGGGDGGGDGGGGLGVVGSLALAAATAPGAEVE